MTLQPLPEPTMQETDPYHHPLDPNACVLAWYDADQMRAYAADAVAAEREACAKVCESINGTSLAMDQGRAECAENCAGAIRARSEQ